MTKKTTEPANEEHLSIEEYLYEHEGFLERHEIELMLLIVFVGIPSLIWAFFWIMERIR